MNQQTKKILSIIAVIVIAVALALVLSFKNTDYKSIGVNSNNGSMTEKGTVAIVNGQKISQSEYNKLQLSIVMQQGIDMESLDEEQKMQLQSQVIESLISQTLLTQVAKTEGAKISKAEVDALLLEGKNQFPDDAAYQDALTSQGLTEEEFQEQIKTSLAVQAYLNETLELESINVSEKEIQELYDQQTEGMEEAPVLEDVHDQVEQMLQQGKQQELIMSHIQELRADADVEILI